MLKELLFYSFILELFISKKNLSSLKGGELERLDGFLFLFKGENLEDHHNCRSPSLRVWEPKEPPIQNHVDSSKK